MSLDPASSECLASGDAATPAPGAARPAAAPRSRVPAAAPRSMSRPSSRRSGWTELPGRHGHGEAPVRQLVLPDRRRPTSRSPT